MIKWNHEKNAWLFENRGVSFDEVLYAIANGKVVADYLHPNQEKFPRQRIMEVEMMEYIYLVPYVIDGNDFFLKTIIPSRKTKKRFFGG